MRKLLRTGLVPARAWRGHAVGIAPTERLKLRRQMAAASAGKKASVSLSLFMEVNNLEVEEAFSTNGHACLGGRDLAGMGKRAPEGRKQIFEVQIWRQVRGPAGAVMCETRDLRIKWPQWHMLLFEGQLVVDMRVVCPQDVKKILLKQARMVCWKKWAAKHEHEELKEGVWLDPFQAMLRRNTYEVWTEKQQHVTRKLVVEEGWVQKRLYDIAWSDEKKCRGCHRE